MKELSIEEKAKRYDEALDRAKKVLLDCTPEERKVVEYISPEIEESEDEKIKEKLMQYLWDLHHKDFVPLTPDIPTCDKWLAWLEKQGKNILW